MDRKAVAEKAFSGVEGSLQGISQWMYDHPEIAMEEYETSAKLSSFLGQHGFEVEYPAYGLDTAFAARVRAGMYGHGVTIKVQGVTEALSAISKTIQLAGKPSPIYREEGKYQLSIQRMV